MPNGEPTEGGFMPRKLNPNYIRRIMAREEIRGLETVFLTGSQFGVANEYSSILVNGDWIDSTNHKSDDRFNYRGWNKPSKLYCQKCHAMLVGIPREIIQNNWCEFCKCKLYKEDDFCLDQMGLWLYRDKVTLYMRLAVQKYRQVIDGGQNIFPNGLMENGFHKDHIYSVRDAFENDIPEFVVSAPPNIRVMQGKKNISKGRKSDCTLDEILAKYDKFLQQYPEWPKLALQCYEQQTDFVQY